MADEITWRYTCDTHGWKSAREPCPAGDGTDNRPPHPTPEEDAIVIDVVVKAATSGISFAEWLARSILAPAAARLGSTGALLSSRPGCWEADFVRGLLAGTVGEDDRHLSDFGEETGDGTT